MKIIWSPLAIDRVRVVEIADYIAKDEPNAAEKWVDTIFSKVERLAIFSRSGRIVPEINNEQYREIIYGNYRIVYRIEKEQLSILTVRHGKQVLSMEDIVEHQVVSSAEELSDYNIKSSKHE
ncbi:MAG: plasmid stabilization protein [Deltaproteobacteria bacterium]|nr:MAG: plasmid stabilization protein [Deltaproteobacteria bacterium]